MDSQTEIEIYNSILIAVGAIFIFAIAVVLFFLRYRRGLYKQELIIEQQESEHRLDLLKATLEVTEQERKRIAEELHDAIGAHLAVTKMSLNALKAGQTSDVDLQNLIDASKETINETIHTVREISHDLYPPGLAEFGFKDTMADLFDKLALSNTIKFEFYCNYEFVNTDKVIQLNLYRITQEFLTNTLRYAEASKVSLNLEKVQNELHYTYQDNGKGMDLNASRSKGLGFLNIESRIKVVEASIEFKSALKKGFSARIKIPIHE